MLNHYLILKSIFRRSWKSLLTMACLVAIAFAICLTSSLTDRMIKQSSTRAADYFDLIIGARSSPVSLLLGTVYLKEEQLPLIPASVLRELRESESVGWASPVVVGDMVEDFPLVGGTTDLATFGGKVGFSSGGVFKASNQAVVGALTGYKVGDRLEVAHGRTKGAHGHHQHHDEELVVCGVREKIGTPWDKSVIVPVEWLWLAHHQYPEGEEFESWTGKDMQGLPGFSALVVKPKKISDAYKLRQAYSSKVASLKDGAPVNLMAIFTGEVLVSLYSMLDTASYALSVLNFFVLGLALIAVFGCCYLVAELHKDTFTQLRTMGAPASYVRRTIFELIFLTIIFGIACGIVLGFVFSGAAAFALTEQTGIAMNPSVGWQEVETTGIALLICAVGAWLQSAVIANRTLR